MGAEGRRGDRPLREWVERDEMREGWAGQELYRESPQRQLVLL